MREIKFRGFTGNKWVYGWLVQNIKPVGERSVLGTMEIYEPYGDHFIEYEVLDKSIGQFTGLLDNNGKEIYEGDIVVCDATDIGGSKFIAEVIYCSDITVARTVGYGLWVKNKGYAHLDLGVYEVIGNIYENPSLLEGDV